MRSRRFLSSFPVLLLALWVGWAAARAQDLAQYAGQYRSVADPSQVTAVYLDGGDLYEESAQRQRQRVVPDAAVPDRFAIAAPPAHLVFLRNAADQIAGLKVTLDADGRT